MICSIFLAYDGYILKKTQIPTLSLDKRGEGAGALAPLEFLGQAFFTVMCPLELLKSYILFMSFWNLNSYPDTGAPSGSYLANLSS